MRRTREAGIHRMCIAQGTDRCSCTQQQWCVCSKPQRPGVAIAHDSDAQILFTGGMSYAAVPLYRAFCAATGFAGTPQVGQGKFAPERLVPSETTRRIKVQLQRGHVGSSAMAVHSVTEIRQRNSRGIHFGILQGA